MKIGKYKSHIEYFAGVKQGENLAPNLFIIVMHFLAEILEQKWKENNILIPTFYHNSNLYNKGGKLIRHNTICNKKGGLSSYKYRRPFTKDELFSLLYVDDGVLIFINRSDAILRSKIAFMQMKRMGLNMHVGIGDKQSKTKDIFFPTRDNIQNWRKDYIKDSLPSTTIPIIDPDAPKNKNLLLKKKKTTINKCYDKYISTKDITDDFGIELDDYSDNSLIFKKDNQAIGALKLFWYSEHANIKAKF